MSSTTVPVRPGGFAALAGGLVITGLGIFSALNPATVAATWFVLAGVAAELLVVALLGLRTALDDVRGTRVALAVAAVGMALFGLAHFYALVDEDTAILLFSVFMVAASVAIVVAGVMVVREGNWSGARRFVPLLCGVWPLATIPAAAAVGDLPHFLAIAVWGLCWAALGLSLLSAATTTARRAASPAGI